MSLYPKIDDFSILLDNDCKRMLRRTSRKLIICEVVEKLSNGDKKETIFIDNNNSNNIKEINLKNNNLYEMVLNILGCNKS